MDALVPTRTTGGGPPIAAATRARDDRPQRHTGDLVRAGLGLAVFGVAFLIAQQGQLSAFERDLFRIVNDLPAIVLPVVWAVMQLGNVLAVPTLAAVALVARRFRLARDLLVSGLLAYEAADLVKSMVGRERPAGLPVGAVLHEGPLTGAGFISGHAAVAAALATAAAPYLSRRPRRVVWALAWAVALARVYVGAHLPLDVVGGVAVGWAIGSLVHWAFGVPAWAPSPAQVTQLLDRLGLPVREVTPAGTNARISHPFTAVDSSGRRLFVKVLEPDRFERDWLFRLARLVAVRDVKDADALAPLDRQAEHEAVTAMSARERDVRVPRVVLARGTGRGAVIVQEYVSGRPLSNLGTEEVSTLLGRLWEQVALLREARVAHRDLSACNVLVDDAGQLWIVDFGNAETGADDDALAGDLAELMASLAMTIKAAPLVSSAVDRLGRDVVAAAVPRLAPLALSAATRDLLRTDRSRLADLRQEARRQAGVPDPERLDFGSAGPAAWLTAIAAAVVVFTGLAVVTGALSVFQRVEVSGWRWLGGAVVLAVLARGAAAAAAAVAVDRRLGWGRVYAATLVADGANLRRGPVDRRRVAARFLERAGVPPAPAERAIDRNDIGAVAAAALVMVITLVLAVVEGQLPGWRAPSAPVATGLLGVVALLLVLAGQAVARGRVRRDGPVPARLRASVLGLPGSTWRGGETGIGRWAALISFSALGIALEAAALAATLHGVDGSLSVLAAAGAYTVLRLLWTVLPVTGAPGLAEASLFLSLTALGAPAAGAGAAVLTFRLLIFWLPAAIGWLFASHLEQRMLL